MLRSALVLATVALCLLPWMVCNYRLSHRLVFASPTYAPEQDHVWGYYAWYQNWLRDLTWTSRVNWDYVICARETIPHHPFPDYAYDSEAERQVVGGLMRQIKAVGRFSPEIDRRFALLAQANYLLHTKVMKFAARGIRQLVPWMLAHQVLLIMPVTLAVGLGIPLLFMAFVSKSPVRRSYRYLFG